MSATLILLLLFPQSLPAQDVRFERTIIDADFPGAYQVEIADVDGDGRNDVIALGGDTIAWYQNPTWVKRIIGGPDQTPAVISSATIDIDGDGKAEIAIAYDFAMNEPHRGKLALAVQDAAAPTGWRIEPVGNVPSIHRVRWGDVTGGPNHDLIAAPIFGPNSRPPSYDQDQAHLWIFADWNLAQPPTAQAAQTPITRSVWHAIDILPDKPGKASILSASNEGIARIHQDSLTELNPGTAGPVPNRGSSEIHLGHMADGRRFLTTIEPWHGNKVVLYPEQGDHGSWRFPARFPIGTLYDQGHALCVADVDADGTDEIFAGNRGPGHRVTMYHFANNTWTPTDLDLDIAAQDLRAGDLDGDGTPDIVAVGGSTKNVVWYRPIRAR